MTTDTIKTSLDDLISLLLQNQAPFGDDEFTAAAHHYRNSTPGGAAARQQVNLAASLYLQVKSERITEPRIRELGGWGQRNAMLTDIAAFTRGRRPVTSSTSGRSMMALGAPPADILQIAVSQGLDAAQKMLEQSIRVEFNQRIDEIQVLADQRVQAAERNVFAATELKEAAQAESRLLEQKYDQAITGRMDLTSRAVAAEARAGELTTQVAAVTTALNLANSQLEKAELDASQLHTKVEALLSKAEADRRESMLAIDRARHGNDQMLANLQSDLARLNGLLEKSQAAGEGHAQAARHAGVEAAKLTVELATAMARMDELQAQHDLLVERLGASTVQSVALEKIAVRLTEMGGTIEAIKSREVATPGDVANVLQLLVATDKTIQVMASNQREEK